jgi:cation diffusion facilitator family transporter
VHSTADCGNQLLLLLGIRRAKRPPSHEYPLGYGKETYFWSFIVALMLFSVGGMFSVYEGWHKLHSHEELSSPLIALGVLAFGIVAESFSMWGCLREVNKVRGSRSLWRWFRTSRNAELVVIFGEDLAALFGLIFAFAAVSLAWATGNPAYDAIGSIGIGILLIVIAVLLGREIKALLVGQSVEDEVLKDMCDFLQMHGEVDKILKMVTLQMGPDVMVAVKARMKPAGSELRLIEKVNATEVAFKQKFPQVAFLFFEPDVRD